ncbi:MAG: carbon-nitrogen hydrolase [Thermodesulfobacteriota bacterium]|nr:MAG: carbon-nitrogen hydrolase [Thermodesulfobacteriota bacterium]
MEKIIRTAGIQIAPSGDGEKNLKKSRELIELAADEGAAMAALPELFNTPWFPSAIDKNNFALAEEADGRTITSLRETAAKKKILIVATIFEKDGADHFNTAFVIGDDGSLLGKYRKMHVPSIPLWEEKSYFSPGNLGFPVFETPLATIGVQICWDVFFPEGFRILALKGAEIIFAPTASAFYHSHRKWDRAIAAGAHSNGVFIFRVNRVGAEERQEFYGRSFCVRPDGEFLIEPSGASEGIVLADVDLGEIASTRTEWVFLKDRRPGEYGKITEETGEGKG